MNLTFGKASLETIKRIQELAERKEYYIIIGFDTWSSRDADKDIVRELKEQGIVVGDEFSYFETGSKFWLELHRKDGKEKFDYLVYCETEYILEGSDIEGEYGGFHSDTDTKITSSFDLKDATVHLNYPYRWGVILGCFANHVAKKLGEPNHVSDIVY